MCFSMASLQSVVLAVEYQDKIRAEGSASKLNPVIKNDFRAYSYKYIVDNRPT